MSIHLVTLTGANPVDTPPTEPDRERYLDKQVRPAMEPTLGAFGLDFDLTAGDDRQDTLLF